MTQQVVSWVDKHFTDVVKIGLIAFGILYGYITLQSDVSNLKELRKTDKESIEKTLVEIKVELRDLKLVLIEVIKQRNNNDN